MTFIVRLKRLWHGPELPARDKAIAAELGKLDRRWKREPAYDGRPLYEATLGAADVAALATGKDLDEVCIAIHGAHLVATRGGAVSSFPVSRRLP